MLKRILILVALAISPPILADSHAPWGSAKVLDIAYSKQKVVYDTAVSSVAALTSVLDRASYLSVINGADPFDNKIVIVLHGNEIDYFATRNYPRHKALMDRAQSLSVGGIIEFRMCRIAAQSRGYAAKDIHGFVSMVPMGDAEIVRLQHEGYGYMR
ncbi:MAG: DsrE family protein [Thiobacillus sp.]|nr:DsrE family protein [Thiobacillus sp.]